jgi:hypothetical protein
MYVSAKFAVSSAPALFTYKENDTLFSRWKIQGMHGTQVLAYIRLYVLQNFLLTKNEKSTTTMTEKYQIQRHEWSKHPTLIKTINYDYMKHIE